MIPGNFWNRFGRSISRDWAAGTQVERAGRNCWLCLLLAIALGLGCSKYERVHSEESLRIIRALYTACSAKDVDRLSKVKERLERHRQTGLMTPDEAQAFASIIQLAEDRNWERATREAFRFAQDQVR